MLSNVNVAKAAAKRLQHACQQIGRSEKLTRCQAAIAEACGFNNWIHLTKTLGTEHAPVSARERELVFGRFGEAVGRWWSKHSGIDLAALFATTFEHGLARQTPELDARLSAAIRSLPVSAGFGRGLNVYEFGGEGSKPIDVRIPLQGKGAGLEARVVVSLAEETSDTAMPMREVKAWLTQDGQLKGFIQATLYIARRRGGVSVNYATEVADMVSDTDVWAVRNLARVAGPDVFSDGVAILWWWELQTGARGNGIGPVFLSAVVSELKRRFRRLRTLALDPKSIEGLPDFRTLPGGFELMAIAHRKLARYISELELGSLFGPDGHLVLFDNSRHGSEMETLVAMGAIYSGEDEDTVLAMGHDAMQAVVIDAFRSNSERMETWADDVRRQEPRPLRSEEFPEGWSPHVAMFGGRLEPHPDLARHLPTDTESLIVTFNPPSLDFRAMSLQPSVQSIVIGFGEGRQIKLAADWIQGPALSPGSIERLNRETPAMPELPRWAKGDLLAVLGSNLRLVLKPSDQVDDRIPWGSWLQLPRGTGVLKVSKFIIDWPDAASRDAFMADLIAAWKAATGEVGHVLAKAARDVLGGGWLEREMYEDVWQGQPVIRQRFNARPWKDPQTLTLGGIQSLISPTEPFEGCPANETFGDRFRALIAADVLENVAQTLSLHEDVCSVISNHEHFPKLFEGLSTAAISPFLPGLWKQWIDLVGNRKAAFDDVRLVDLAQLADA